MRKKPIGFSGKMTRVTHLDQTDTDKNGDGGRGTKEGSVSKRYSSENNGTTPFIGIISRPSI